MVSVEKIIVNCYICNTEIKTYKKNTRKFCSRVCLYAFNKGRTWEDIHGKEKSLALKEKQSAEFSGKNNPNFGNSWTDEQRKVQSEKISLLVDDDFRINCAKGMSGKTVSDETKEKKFITMELKKSNGWVKPDMSDETKLKIGQKSKEKFLDPTHNHKKRLAMEAAGAWVPLDLKNDYLLYKDLSNWKESMLSYEIKGKDLLKSETFFHMMHNRKGIVRDHMYSRFSGFKNKVFPEIIRHPANCEIMTHSNNVKKRQKDSILLNELFDKIMLFNEPYHEQELCEELIIKYKAGNTYNKQLYINENNN
jgi:hypothetical protein